ncbi:DUF58 domain-containing protein [Flavobacteriales bacterium]|nr:DUF58 domain-containing protein [Flavobacteriales bacterium]
MKNLFLQNRLFVILLIIVVGFALSFGFSFLFPIFKVALLATVALLLVDIFILFFKKQIISVNREMSEQLSLGDINNVKLTISSSYTIPLDVEVIDELPFQLQKRDSSFSFTLSPSGIRTVLYTIEPKERGVYEFGNVNVYVSSVLGLIQRRFSIDKTMKIGVYPSIMQMRKHDFQVFNKSSNAQGVKKIRRLGNTNEFEQIKEYVKGDNYRHINWKATSRRSKLMVNQYQDEKSQQIYFVIDKSRTMKMPFEGLTLLDYAINSSLVMSNVALKKGDKAGLITFSDKIGTQLKATKNSAQLRKIMELLYTQKTQFLEANYELLYQSIRQTVKGRSLLIMYLNFESFYSLKRALPILRRLNKSYLLVVVFFENTEITNATTIYCDNVSDIYLKTFAQKFTYEKKVMVQELRKFGIQSILSKPEDLSVNSINKYLELKSRGMI